MKVKDNIDINNIEVGVIVARFQVHELHEGHKDLIDEVCKNHNMVIIFLGIPVIQGTNKNPLDFSARKSMVQEYAPDAIILPLKDQRSNAKWSYLLDNQISIPFGERSAVIYGSRDSFIPYYEGKYPTLELETNVYTSGTEVRKNVSKQLLSSSDFRAGIIQSTYMRRPITWSTVDVCPYDSKGRILLGKKPNESVWGLIGGLEDRTIRFEESAARKD
jgi:bifunctional NMN adenylyltransferase/nudix hydrolase